MRPDYAILCLLNFANLAHAQEIIERHAKECRELGIEAANENYLNAYKEEERKNPSSGVWSWFNCSPNLLPATPPPPPDMQPRQTKSLRRRIAKGVAKGVVKGVSKGAQSFWKEVTARDK
jgi:hypothetical protein